MADKRINALANTASSTASDDFIAVDGTTNGTRKLNAFSPTFGGNATVTGTLTANGLLTAAATTSLDGLPTAAIFGATKRVVLGYNTSSDYGFIASADSGTTWKELHLNPSGGLVKVPSTSASTSTSTGALVVGNGTSGGLGVGGAVNIGGTLTVNGATAFIGANTGSPYVLIKGGSSGTNGGGSLVVENGSGGSVIGIGNVSAIAGGAYNNDPVVWYAGSESLRFYNASTEVANFSSTGVLSLLSTTASTSTSSGALVVSGGVGVAGAVNAGTFYGLVDGVTTPATESGYARIYVDSADGDLKVKFGDGTVKTIATDS